MHVKIQLQGVYSVLRGLLKFWEISSAIISETVQDSDVVTMQDSQRKSQCPIEWHQYQWPWMTLRAYCNTSTAITCSRGTSAVAELLVVTSIGCRRWTRATRSLIHASCDTQRYDKPAKIVGRTSTVASIVNCVRPTTVANLSHWTSNFVVISWIYNSFYYRTANTWI